MSKLWLRGRSRKSLTVLKGRRQSLKRHASEKRANEKLLKCKRRGGSEKQSTKL